MMISSRSKKTILNILVQIVLEIVTIFSGFIVPKLIINYYGSDTNGLIVSISQFLGYLTLLQSGVGGVAKAALYKPLAENNISKINALVNSMARFFKKLAKITLIYIIILIIIFPTVLNKEFDFIYTALLIVIIGIGTFAQYYYGITYQLLLQADQRYYIYTLSQITVVVLNMLIAIIMIKNDIGIHLIKFISALVFLIRPVWLESYCLYKYKLNKKLPADEKLLKQRWDGIGHTIAYFIHSKTDVFLLTVLGSLNEVSVYSIYYSLVASISLILNTIANSIQAAFGNMIACDESASLKISFKSYICINNIMLTVLMSTTTLTIIPFMQIYTKNITDVNYIRPLFSGLLIMAESIFCIRMPYQTIVLAAGHYKQTKKGAYMEAVINILVSLALIWKYGMTGIVIGTIIALSIRTFQYIHYATKFILKVKQKKYFLSSITDVILIIISYFVSRFLFKKNLITQIGSYIEWVYYAGIVFLVTCVIALLVYTILFYEDICSTFIIIKKMLKKKDGRLKS